MIAERRRNQLEGLLRFWKKQMWLGARFGRLGNPRNVLRLEAELTKMDAAGATSKPCNPVY